MRLAVFILMAGIGHVHAQMYSKYFAAAADFNKPIVNTEFIGDVSRKGGKILYREFITDRFSVGGEFGMATYKDYIPPAVYNQDNLAIYTDIYPFVYSYSLALSGEYFFMTEKVVMPYAGVGIGVAYNQFVMYYNVFKQDDKRWGALVRPHAGAILRFGKNATIGLMADVHLDYATTKSEDTDYTSGFATLGFQAGIVFLKR